MSPLLVCALPGDEAVLFGNAVLAQPGHWEAVLGCADPVDEQSPAEAEEWWRTACLALGVTPRACLGLPLLADGNYDREVLRERAQAHAGDHAVIYVPDIEDSCGLRRALAAAFAGLREEVLMEAATGVGTGPCAVDAAGHQLLVEILNQHYPQRLRQGRLGVRDLRGVRQYRRLPGEAVTRFSREFLSWQMSDVRGENPWDLETSAYEQARFAVELGVLRSLPWRRMIEVGACVGTFTQCLADAFPDREIRAYEPNEALFGRLQQRLGGRVEVRRGGAEDVREPCDLLYVSSVLYYLPRFPLKLLDVPARWLVVSHLRSYHDETLSPALRSAGWSRVERQELAPRIEDFCGIPVLKDGTEVAVWQRG